MYHYVYLLEFPDGMKYVGAHSTTILPSLDSCYLGSGKRLPPRDRFSCTKTVLREFGTRQEAINYEIELIEKLEAVSSDLYYNLRKSTHDRHGGSLPEKTRRHLSEIATGRKRTGYGEKYSGSGRTPAQIAGSTRGAEKVRGTKDPRKGKPGAENNGFAPWYYITPSGEYVEVHDRTKEEVAPELGFTSRQLGHGFHHTNMHKQARTLPRKGWTFGNLPKPTDLGKD